MRCRCGEECDDALAACPACGLALGLQPPSSSSAAPAPDEADGENDPTLLSAAYVDDETGRTLLSPRTGQVEPEPRRERAVRCEPCGAPLEAGWRFCKACGQPTDSAPGSHGLARVHPSGPAATRPLRDGRTLIGRTEGDMVFPEDSTLSSRHAAFTVSRGRCEVADLGSTNGTFVSIRGEEPLSPGDLLLAGGTRLLYRLRAGRAEIVEMMTGGAEGRRVRLGSRRCLVGKDEAADLRLDDDHASRRHCEIVRAAAGHAVRDLGSTNRTYILLTAPRVLRDGDRVAAGAQLLEYRRLD